MAVTYGPAGESVSRPLTNDRSGPSLTTQPGEFQPMRATTLLLLALATAACAKEPAPPAAEATAATVQQVTVTATDYGFQLPTTPIDAGLTTFTLVNQGTEVHHLSLMHLTDGKTVDDFMAAVQAEGPPPSWVVPVGGPNAAAPGSSANATLILETGTYVIACFIPSPDGVPHLAKGMIMGMEVQPATGPVAALPPGDIQLGLLEYSFALSQTPTTGTHTFVVRNQGHETHEVVLVKLSPGMTPAQLGAWFEGGQKGPPPGVPVAGVTGLAPGQVQNFSADFTAGTYGLICFVPGPDGAPHFVHGMTATFTVS